MNSKGSGRMFSQQPVRNVLALVALAAFGALIPAWGGQTIRSESSADVPPIQVSDAEVAKASALAAAQPGSAEVWVRFGDALNQKGRETADAAYAMRAEKAYRKALEISPKRVDALVGMAWVSGIRHEFESSIEWATKAIAIDANNTAAHGLIGDAALEMGDYDEAFAQYQKMLDLRPDLSSYGRSAHLLHITGDTRRATFLMMKAIGAGSPYAENTAWCRAQLGLIYYSEGAYLPAEQVLEEGLRKLPNDYHLLAAMGKVKAAKKEYDAAIDDYRRAVAIAPQQDVVAALGDLYALTGKPEESRKQFEMVESIARINKANGVTGDMLSAKFYADHDRKLEQALKMAEEEFKTRKNVYAADTLAWCYFKNGQLDQAKRYINVALRQKTSEALFHYHKGMIYTAAGDRTTAQLELYTALSINPNFDPMQVPIAIKTNEELGSKPTGATVADVTRPNL
jgi:tetratricopeptide (TPR) repeat protein